MAIDVRTREGFALVELMIVVAIVSILVSIALPAFQEYQVRARVSDGLAAASGAMASVGANVAIGAPDSCAGVSTFAGGSPGNVDSMTCDAGVITVTMDAVKAKGVVLVMTPTQQPDGRVTWTCATAEASFRYVPPDCRNAS